MRPDLSYVDCLALRLFHKGGIWNTAAPWRTAGLNVAGLKVHNSGHGMAEALGKMMMFQV